MSEKATKKTNDAAGPAKKTKAVADGVHPSQHTVKVVMTDGSTFDILTTWGKEGSTLRLDVDPKNHPAWQDKAQNFINVNNERIDKFNKKFGGFGSVVAKKA